jgi:hypothetical protein
MDSPMSVEQEYIPGICNIGPAEIARRKQAAYIGALLTIVTTIALLSTHSSHIVRLVALAPTMIFATGLVQSAKRFCLAFGLLGVFNFGTLGKTQSVEAKAARAADRKTAIGILLQSFVIAFLMTAIIELLP